MLILNLMGVVDGLKKLLWLQPWTHLGPLLKVTSQVCSNQGSGARFSPHKIGDLKLLWPALCALGSYKLLILHDNNLTASW